MSPIADDFAAISKRLKEIEQEAAAEAAARTRRNDVASESNSPDVYEDITTCN
jgi:hypothetical protein